MTELEFGKVFSRLAQQLRWNDYSADAVRDYFDALHSYPLEAIDDSARALAQQAGRRFFPTTGEWAEFATKVSLEALHKYIPHQREKPWEYDCETCDDTGWERFECTGDSFCGRQKKHLAHSFVRPCACRATNRTWQRHQTIGAGE